MHNYLKHMYDNSIYDKCHLERFFCLIKFVNILNNILIKLLPYAIQFT